MVIMRQGDALTVLQSLPERSVRCCVTSPPYWGLRDYGTAKWEGGESGCDHSQKRIIGSSTLRNDGRKNIGTQPYEKTAATVVPFRDICGKCGAIRIDQQLGLEKTPEEYVANMVNVFREVRRVLTDDGTLWLNLGDSYADGRTGPQGENGAMAGRAVAAHRGLMGVTKAAVGCKPKDLVGIPWRVAFALQSDGWYLRSDIIWAKPNPMPESVTDRPTKSHEYLFLLSKQAKYFYDADAIAEPATFPDGPNSPQSIASPYGQGFTKRAKSGNVERKHGEADGLPPGGLGRSIPWEGSTRNARSVWTISTTPYPGAHFATFPEELARRCIVAGSAPGDTVLDPFGGSGTVAAVAVGNGRKAVYIDLNPKYHELARDRIGPAFCGAA